jgi:hypothetical protein
MSSYHLNLKFLAFGFFPPISLVIVFFCDSSRVEHECLNALTETPGEPNMEIILSGRMTFAIHKTLRFTLCKYFYSENNNTTVIYHLKYGLNHGV